ncbi:MAG: NUDIX hydrolase [Clostridia bacterium]|nr:NUDIX hydrolase [Clostridia bacterium]
MQYEEKTVRKTYIYQGKILSLRVDDAILPDGKPCKREIVEHSGGACALCVEAGKVLFVKQYRYAYGETVYELPAGKLNAGEDPFLAAQRELEEETGVRAEKLELLYEIYPSVGYTNERIYIYLAHGGKRVEAHLDEGEFLDVEWIELERVRKMLKSGEIKDAKTVIALQAYLLMQ